MAVIIAHQGGGRIAEGFLRVEGEHVLIARIYLVKADANGGEKIESGAQVGCVLAPIEGVEPANGVEIAQAAGSFLNIGLQVIDGVLGLGVAGFGEAGETLAKRHAAAGEKGAEAFVEPIEHLRIAGKKTAIEQADGELGIAVMLARAIVDGVHGVAGAEAGIPKSLEELGHSVAHGRDLSFEFDHEQEVDVGMREQLGASESAGGEQGGAERELTMDGFVIRSHGRDPRLPWSARRGRRGLARARAERLPVHSQDKFAIFL